MTRRFDYPEENISDFMDMDEEDYTAYIDENGRRTLKKRQFRTYMDGDWAFLDDPDDF